MTPMPQRYYKFPCDNCKHDGNDCPVPETLYTGSLDRLQSFQKIVAIIGCKHLDTQNPHAPTIQEYQYPHTSAPAPEPNLNQKMAKQLREASHMYRQGLKAEAAKAAREQGQKQWQKLEDYINANSPWMPGTDDRVTDARKLIAKVRSLRHQQEAEQPKEGRR